MKITIITVTYNSASTLPTAIESVLGQSYPNIEYIIVDGASTDGTRELLESYGTRISKWVSEKDNGIYDAMNKGLRMATGDYTGFLHADDILASSTVIEEMVAVLTSANPDVVYGDLEYVQKDDVNRVVRYWQSCDFNRTLLKKGWMPPHPTVYVRTSLFQSLGGFDISFKISADYHFLLRLLSLNTIKAKYLNMLMIKMRVGGASNRSLKNIIRKSKEDYRALKISQVGGLRALLLKNIGKLHQFVVRKNS
jgi:glycosyltransferase